MKAMEEEDFLILDNILSQDSILLSIEVIMKTNQNQGLDEEILNKMDRILMMNENKIKKLNQLNLKK